MDDRMRGFTLARLELAIGTWIVVVIPVLFIGQPSFVGGPPPTTWAPFVPIVGEAMAIIGLAWMVRIWRGPLLDRPPVWRYREDD